MNIKTLFIAATLLVASQLSFALTLDEAREKGMLGENASGYVEITPRGNADAKAVMEEVNTKRKAKYQAMIKAGKPPKVALTALMRKLIELANALIKANRLWVNKWA